MSKDLKRINIIVSILLMASPIIGFIAYLPFAETAYGSLDPIRGFFFGPMFFVPFALLTYFITYVMHQKEKHK